MFKSTTLPGCALPTTPPETSGDPPEALRTVLFDLDGTLADTAPDLAYALNQVLAEQGHEGLALERVRPLVSLGGRAMVELACGLPREAPGFEALYLRFLSLYQENLATRTKLFPEMEAVLAHLEAKQMNWGIVTNKVAFLTVPLVQALGLADRAACVVSGDSTPRQKPHPDPLLLACEQTGSHPRQCLYVGDAPRDIVAGQRAGMRTLVALFGYIPAGEDPLQWGADGTITTPLELIQWLDAQREPSMAHR
ncbi:MAG: HAD-IA family hydrolase [Gammaproteobacteria bacterium]|jgi:phosphoglycolate phosphatase